MENFNIFLKQGEFEKALAYLRRSGEKVISPEFLFDQYEKYDWVQVFGHDVDKNKISRNDYQEPEPVAPGIDIDCSNFGVNDVFYAFGYKLGQNDGESWKCCGQLKDLRFFYVEASCDYTGWG